MKKITFFGLSLSLIILFTSCSDSKEENTEVNQNDKETIDFEGMSFFNSNIKVLSSEFSRSGKWSLPVDSLNIFSLTYDRPFIDILNKKYKSAKISIWFKAVNPTITDASFVTSITDLDGSVNYGYETVSLGQFKENKEKTNIDKAGWKKVEINLNFPAKTEKPASFRIYAWSPLQEAVYFDDLEIEYFK